MVMRLQNAELPGMAASQRIEFALIAESGVLERQAVLLCESIRKFAGRYADSPITVISPRTDRRPSEATLTRLSTLDVRYLPLDITSIAPEYGTSFRMYAAAELERLSKAEKILFMDSDLLFAGEPDLDLPGMAAAARPVDVKGMCTEGARDPCDRYWTRLCELCGIDYERVPFVKTTVGDARVKASYNGGFVLVDRKAEIFGRTLKYFKHSIDAGIAPFRGVGGPVRAGHGWVSERGSKLWGSSQACLSLAIWGSGLSVRTLDSSHNFPLHLFEALNPEEQSTPLRVIHYHHLLDEDPTQNPLLNGRANISEEFSGWLCETLVLNQIGSTDKHARNKLVVVLGMHRSGTSAITRSLKVMDINLGDNLIPAKEESNPKGFWEDREVNALNIRMLLALETDWHRLAPIEQGDVELLNRKGYFIGAVALLFQKTRDMPVFGLKDPRMAKLLPFWKPVMAKCQLDARYVITLRHPLSVVRSLECRDGFDARHGYFLWLGHVIASLSGTVGCNRVLVDYDRLMQSPEFEVNRIAESLECEIDPTELRIYQYEFLDKNLRHTVYGLDELQNDEACPPLVREMYNTLLDVASDKLNLADPELQKRITSWSEEFERMKVLLILADKLTTGLAERNGQLMAFKRSISWRITKPLRSLKKRLSKHQG